MSIKKYVFGKDKKATGLDVALFAYYKLDSDYNDSLTGTYNGVGGGLVQIGAGKIGNGAYFGLYDFSKIDILESINQAFNFTDGTNDLPFTVSMWVKFDSFSDPNNESQGNWLINKRNAKNGGDQWQMIKYMQQMQFTKFDKANRMTLQTIAFPADRLSLNTWYHLVYTDEGTKMASGMRIYVNGVKQSVEDISIGGIYTGMSTQSTCVTIGAPGWGEIPSLGFNGTIDEIAVWKNRALNQSDINSLYNFGNGKTYPL